MIVKLQVSISSSNGRRVLVYDEAQTIWHEEALSPDIELLMGGKLKAFFHAKIDEKKQLRICEGAGWHEW